MAVSNKEKNTRFNKDKFVKATARLERHLRLHSGGLNKLINLAINYYGHKSNPAKVNPSTTLTMERYWNSLIFCRRKVPILATRHVSSLANQICQALLMVDVDSYVIFEKPEQGFEDQPHIVLCPQMFKELPDVYFAFQLEQTINPRWMTEEYFCTLNHAVAIIDYSIDNIEYFLSKGFNYRQLFYLPIRATDINFKPTTYNYDLLFYGDPTSLRRKKILEELSKHFKIKVCSEVFGKDLQDEIRKARVVVNIHYYENALLESVRLAELISLGKIIVSERGANETENEAFEPFVSFVDNGDTKSLIKVISDALKIDPEQHAKEVHQKLSGRFNDFRFYLYRMLLAFDLISFDQFYYTVGKTVDIQTVMGLSLTECIDRQASFKSRNPTIPVFQGLRHCVGWKGCGLSYKFLIKRAKDLGYEQITICEDDALLPDNWQQKIKEIENYLAGKEWDIFSGLIAVAHKDTLISDCEKTPLGRLVLLDKITSTVFCVYNKSIFDRLIIWDHLKIDNHIDRFIQRIGSLKAYCLLPFFVKMVDAESTLWDGVNNNTYADMAKKSQSILEKKTDDFLRSINR